MSDPISSPGECRCTCGGIDAVPHATDHAKDCAIWNEVSPPEAPDLMMVKALGYADGCLEIIEREGVEAGNEGVATARQMIDAALNAVETDEVRKLRDEARKRVYGLVALAQEMRDRDTDGSQVGEAAFILGAVEAINEYVGSLRWWSVNE